MTDAETDAKIADDYETEIMNVSVRIKVGQMVLDLPQGQKLLPACIEMALNSGNRNIAIKNARHLFGPAFVSLSFTSLMKEKKNG